MIDWRELMPNAPADVGPRSRPQKPQKGSSGRGFEDIEDKKPVRKSGDSDRSTSDQWIEAWRDLAKLTEGITKNDSRFKPVCDGLEECDRAFEADDWPAFQQAARAVKRVLGR